jgi:sulfite exporter TauE/SafE
MLQLSVAVVSAALLGAMAIIVAVQLTTASKVDALASKVDALPGEIRSELTEVIRTVSTAVSAGNSRSEPVVVVLPAQGEQEIPERPATAAPSE